MPSWKDNPIMTWNGTKVTDHGRKTLTQDVEFIGNDKRMADGTLRRQFIARKKKWNVSWEMVPSSNNIAGSLKTADGGMSGEQIEEFYFANQGKFRMILRRGSAMSLSDPSPAESAIPFEDSNFYVANVMFTEFSKEVVKRGKIDFWNINVTLEEV